MAYNIRYLAKYIVSLKDFNVFYILPYKQQLVLYTRNDVKYSFLLSSIYNMLTYGQMVLHANLQSEMVLTIFTFLLRVIIFNRL